MANTVRLKRSAVAGRVPTTSNLALGELGINTNDGALYMKRDAGTAEIVRIAFANQDYGLITGSVSGFLDYTAVSPVRLEKLRLILTRTQQLFMTAARLVDFRLSKKLQSASACKRMTQTRLRLIQPKALPRRSAEHLLR